MCQHVKNKKGEIMKTLNIIPLILITVLLFGCETKTPVSSDSELSSAYFQANTEAKTNTKSTADIFNVVTGDMIGESTLHRNGNGLTIKFKTTGLTPGHAYTLW